MDSVKGAIKESADQIQKKLQSLISGQPEDQLKPPIDILVRKLGNLQKLNIVAIGETAIKEGRPDFAIGVNGLSAGYIELKAPGKGADTALYTGHDKNQWERFSRLPNIIYTDGSGWALYRNGSQVRHVKATANIFSLGAQAVDDTYAKEVYDLLSDFFKWQPQVPSSPKQLAIFLAPICAMLRDEVLVEVGKGTSALIATYDDWKNALFPDMTKEAFADTYAQTVTFALLLARSSKADTLFLDQAISALAAKNTLLSKSLEILTDDPVRYALNASLGMLQRVISSVPSGTMTKGKKDPWLHFYEDFLSGYDPELRKESGVYYTPVQVVNAQVKLVNDILISKMGKPLGFNDNVNTIDPAVGTGTYLLSILEHAMDDVTNKEGKGSRPGRATSLSSNLFGFEIMTGPYAVASLRLTRMLQDYGASLPGDGVQIMLNNTLESPHEPLMKLPLFYEAISREHKRAKRVKETVPVLVCIGNPPYGRHSAATEDNRMMTGGWVRWGDIESEGLLEDFITPVKEAGKGGSLKNLYNHYVYFWRWALWKTFEHELAMGAGIVNFITASSFLDGDAFLGMRSHMRRLCDEIWIIDLGGEGRGTRKDDNVFIIQTPVTIAIAVRYGAPNPDIPASVKYTSVNGSKAEKLAKLQSVKGLESFDFEECPSGWDDEFRPRQSNTYFACPLLTDLMPWQHSGCQYKRTWPISFDDKNLSSRWESFINSGDQNKSQYFKETRDRKITKRYSHLFNDKPIPSLEDEKSSQIEITRYGFRSFDRQYAIADSRVGDFLRPVLWKTHSIEQIYFSGMLSSNPLGRGPGLTVSSEIPDLHYFRGSYGSKDIIPAFRDKDGLKPNLHPDLLGLLKSNFNEELKFADWICYLYAVLCNPSYTDAFWDDLQSREIRVPITTRYDLFKELVTVGKRLIYLHTFGERFTDSQKMIAGSARCTEPMNMETLPDSYGYDDLRGAICVGEGVFEPVEKTVWEYEVSGLKVVQSWLGYRCSDRKGKKSSPLDDTSPESWTSETITEFLNLLHILEETLELHEKQKSLLSEIMGSGGLIQASDLGAVPNELTSPPKFNKKKKSSKQNSLF